MLIRNHNTASTSVPATKSSAGNHEATPNEIQEITVAINHAIPRYFP